MAILIINPMQSICGDCGEGCDYTEASHTTMMGYYICNKCGWVTYHHNGYKPRKCYRRRCSGTMKRKA